MSNAEKLGKVSATGHIFEYNEQLHATINQVARELMARLCPFEGVSGDFDRCSNTTRQHYEELAACMFGFELDDYYNFHQESEDVIDEAPEDFSLQVPGW